MRLTNPSLGGTQQVITLVDIFFFITDAKLFVKWPFLFPVPKNAIKVCVCVCVRVCACVYERGFTYAVNKLYHR